jgi:hypothetical protein
MATPWYNVYDAKVSSPLGKPVVTVSPGPCCTGSTPSGADFGSDSLQTNPAPGNNGSSGSVTATSGIQEAVNYLAGLTTPGGVIFLLPGVFTLSTSVNTYNGTRTVAYSGIIFRGSGKDVSIVKQPSTSTSSAFNVGVNTQPQGSNPITSHIEFEHMTIDVSAVTVGGSTTIAFTNVKHCVVRNCKLLGNNLNFTIYFAGPTWNGGSSTMASPYFDLYNSILDCELVDLYSNDGLSFCYQQYGVIRNIWENGSRLALYGWVFVGLGGVWTS